VGRRFLNDAAGFYNMIDAVVTPLEFSAAIKIKVGEAVARNVPVLATWDAFDGVRAITAIRRRQRFTRFASRSYRLPTVRLQPASSHGRRQGGAGRGGT
jgi:hypothetical protein